jgi:hypothetical protein
MLQLMHHEVLIMKTLKQALMRASGDENHLPASILPRLPQG